MPLLLAAILYAAGAPDTRGEWDSKLVLQGFPAVGTAILFCLVIGVLFAAVRVKLYSRSHERDDAIAAQPIGTDLRYRWWASFSSALIGAGLAFSVALVAPFLAPFVALTLFPPGFLLIVVVAIAVEIGMLGTLLTEGAREWWASVTGRMLTYAAAWIAFFTIVFVIPLAIVALVDLADGSQLVEPAAILAWLGTSIGGAITAASANNPDGPNRRLIDYLAYAAPWVFLVGLFASLSLFGVSILSTVPSAESNSAWLTKSLDPQNADYVKRRELVVTLVVGLIAIALLAGVTVKVNLFSLHAMYANRLIRCYLGASRAKLRWKARDWTSKENAEDLYATIKDWGPGRGGAPTGVVRTCALPAGDAGCGFAQTPYRLENALTGFDHNDDLRLRDLLIGVGQGGNGYWGPLLLINSAMNLVAGKELAWQERKAESFVLSPLFCGSKSTGYRLVTEDADRELTLGRAIAISGAAASPNMGYHTSQPLTALMTIFNIRLGWWMSNPSFGSTWDAGSPRYLRCLLQEMLGRTDEHSGFVYLSDGGHFDNLGIYELVRRRCQYIVACDGSADPSYTFPDLASVIRKCRTDFGIRIEIDLSPMKPTADSGTSRWHCSVGSIRYDDVDRAHPPGVLVYLKSSLTGDETSDVLEYKERNPLFPHQTTVDQFFSESQFESYRALGYHVARDVFARVVDDVGDVPNATVFSALRRQWFPPSPELDEHFLESAEGFGQIHQELRSDPLLHRLARELYPEMEDSLIRGGVAEAAQRVDDMAEPKLHAINMEISLEQECAELHAVAQMLQVMENAWLRLNLETYSEHPKNRGWMNEFRRWTNSDILNRHWAVLRGEYSHGFVRFCEQQLKLVVYRLTPVRAQAADDRALLRLCQEYNVEWYQDADQGCGLHSRALVRGEDGKLLTWLIWNTPACLPSNRQSYPIGVVAALEPLEAMSSVARCELLVWLRGPYRNTRIGQAILNCPVDDHGHALEARSACHAVDDIQMRSGAGITLLEFIQQELRYMADDKPSLFVRYGASGQAAGDSTLERSMWSAFFHRYGFCRPAKKSALVRDSVLVQST